MNKEYLFSKLFNLPDEEMYMEYLKLSDKDKKEYKNYARIEVEKYKKSALKAEEKLQELQEELNQEKDKYRNLKNKTN